MKELFDLFYAFAKIGLFTFGGGYAMLPMIQREIVENRNWCSDEEIINYFAIGQCTPGVIAVNTATFVGHKVKGNLGGIFATLGVIFPSIVIITIIAATLTNFSDNIYVGYAFSGIRAAVAALIVNAIVKFWKSGVKNIFGFLIFAFVLVLSCVFDISPVIFVLCSVFAGVIYFKAGGKII